MWDYRIVKKEKFDGQKKYYVYDIHEVYYNESGEICGMTEDPATFTQDTLFDDETTDEDIKLDMITQFERLLYTLKESPILPEPKKGKYGKWDFEDELDEIIKESKEKLQDVDKE